jgi:hypothetical protein
LALWLRREWSRFYSLYRPVEAGSDGQGG